MGLNLTLFRESGICRKRDLDKITALFRELTSPRERHCALGVAYAELIRHGHLTFLGVLV